MVLIILICKAILMTINEEVLEDPALESIKETLEEYQNFMNQTEV